MEALDHNAISKILGSTIKSGGRMAFGHFSLMSTTEEIRQASREKSQPVEMPSCSLAEDAAGRGDFSEPRGAATGGGSHGESNRESSR